MSVRFEKECNYLSEAISIMTIYYAKESFIDLQNRLKKKSGYTANIDKILTTMQKIYDEIIKQVELPEELSIYFDYFNAETRTYGLAFCMVQKGLCAENIEVSQLASYMKESFHKSHKSFIACISDGYEESDVQFLEMLEQMQIPDSIKWNILRVYNNYDKHIDILMEHIVKIIPIMRTVYARYTIQFASFYTYWEEACNSSSFYKKLKIATKIDVQDNSELVFHPNWMGCNSVSLIVLPEDTNKMQLLLGLLFSETEFVNDANMTHDEICQRLKLISDSSKYEIMKLIKNKSMYGSQLADKLSLTTATISHHMNGLTSAGLINIVKDSNRVYYQLDKTHVGFLIDQIRKDLYED